MDNDSILDQIERVVRWGDEFRLAFIKCNHPIQREALRRSLLERLSDQRVLEISLEQPIVSLLDEIRLLWNPDEPPIAVCIHGLEHSLREQGQHSPVLGRLNNDRDLIRQTVPAALLIWLSDFALDYIARGAPDFWAWRSGVYEFETDSALWQAECVTAFGDHNAVFLSSLSWEDKQKEIARLEDLLRTSLNLTRQDKRVQQTTSHLLHQLGFLYASLGRQDEALDRYEQSLNLANQLGDRARQGATLNNLSLIYHARGDYETALKYLEEALAIQRAVGDRAEEGATLNNLSQIYHARGNDGTALKYLEEALAIQRAVGDRAGEGVTLNNLSQIYHARGVTVHSPRPLAGEGLGERVVEATPDPLSLTLSPLPGGEGTECLPRGNDGTALEYLEEALAIRRVVGDRAGEGVTLNNLSQIYRARGDYDTALEYLEKALVIQRAIGDWTGSCPTLFNMGHIHLTKNKPQQALACFVGAYRIAKEIGFSETLMNLEKLAEQLGGDGLEFWEQRVLNSVVLPDWRGPVSATAGNSRAARRKTGSSAR